MFFLTKSKFFGYFEITLFRCNLSHIYVDFFGISVKLHVFLYPSWPILIKQHFHPFWGIWKWEKSILFFSNKIYNEMKQSIKNCKIISLESTYSPPPLPSDSHSLSPKCSTRQTRLTAETTLTPHLSILPLSHYSKG